MNIEQRFLGVVSRLFHVDSQNIGMEMVPGDLPQWDSLGHLSLLEELQKEFQITITLEDGMRAGSLKDLLVLVNDSTENDG
jgi:acyl carrier protein